MAHISALDDAKDLLRAGVDGFGHVVRDRDVDAELLAMLRERPKVFFVETLWGERNAIYGTKPAWIDEPLVRATLSDAVSGVNSPTVSRADRPTARAVCCGNVDALHHAGVTLGLGTDTGGVTGGGYFGLASLIELELLVKAGLSPSDAITAGTRTSAAISASTRSARSPPGKSASFIVLDANPLENIANTRKISAVYLDGVEVNRTALQASWMRRRRRRTAEPAAGTTKTRRSRSDFVFSWSQDHYSQRSADWGSTARPGAPGCRSPA